MFKILFVAVSVVHGSTLQEVKDLLCESIALYNTVGNDHDSPENDSPIAKALIAILEIPATDPLYARVSSFHMLKNPWDDIPKWKSMIADVRECVAEKFEERLSALREMKLEERSAVDAAIRQAMEANKPFTQYRQLTRRLRELDAQIDEIAEFDNEYRTFYEPYNTIQSFAQNHGDIVYSIHIPAGVPSRYIAWSVAPTTN